MWRAFLDDEAKWMSQGRFAGSQSNCGHFFSLSKNGAVAEAEHYGIDLNSTVLFEAILSADRILDLTDVGGMTLVFRTLTNRPTASDSFMLDELIEEDTSGTGLTDLIGYWASRNGYNGVLFFNPRLIWGAEVKKKSRTRPRLPWDPEWLSFYLEDFIKKDMVNLVIFRGVCLLSKLKEYRVNNKVWTNNPYFEWPDENIDLNLRRFSEYSSSDLNFQSDKFRTYYVGQVKYEY
ncbi:hypothetical protein CR51_22875 [Caballeronia megalochromosomata]|nr:hypothetical protein CR51_22875 [Caballeronia megalochromosomata]